MIDTVEISHKLQATGMAQKQAEGFAQALFRARTGAAKIDIERQLLHSGFTEQQATIIVDCLDD